MLMPTLYEGRLIKRYKRFLADIETASGEVLCVHCPNTGSMLNCQGEGARVWYSLSDDPKRKLPGTWELVETHQGRLAYINTGRANALVEEGLNTGVIEPLAGFVQLKREVKFGVENSRADFCLTYPDGSTLMLEVKSVTLGFPGTDVAAFPDAVTARGARHLRELTALARAGQRTALLYCVNLSGIRAVRAAAEIDPAYAQALAEARSAGVLILAYAVELSTEAARISHPLTVL